MLQNGIPWVLKRDLDLVAYNKEPTSLCSFMRKLAVEQGLADLEIEYHVSVAKVNPSEAETWLFEIHTTDASIQIRSLVATIQ